MGGKMDLEALEQRLQYRFAGAPLLQQALTHRSHGSVHNERLEFLGDAVLNCVIAQLLFQKYGRLDEGDLSRLRANLVKQQSLSEIAERLGLSDFLRLGEGEMKSGGFRRPFDRALARPLVRCSWRAQITSSADPRPGLESLGCPRL